MKDCECSQMPHRTASILGKPALQCVECGRLTMTDPPIVREAERISEKAWRMARRRERMRQFGCIMVGLYGIALYLMGGMALALAVVPGHPAVGVLSIVALSVVFLFAANTWRAWWNRQFHVEPVPYVAARERVMKGGAL